ncbi:MAG: prephenate dehydratase [Candidatus Kryptoniota bacterium]
MKESRKIKVAFQGELGAYSERAARKFFGKVKLELKPCLTFSNVFHEVESSAANFGVVPVENTLNGGIREVFNLLGDHKVYVVGEIKLKISHVLVAKGDARLSSIRKVYSHPQALMQCRDFLRRNRLKPVEFYDTAGAARHVAEMNDLTAAAISSEEAAEHYRLKVLRRRIENDSENYTRFVIISPKFTVEKNADKTTVIFTLRNMPGALYRALSVFAIRDIDLLSIDSIPLSGKLWEYRFYIDFKGSITEPRCMHAVDNLAELSHNLKVIGSFKSGETVS